MWGGRGELCVHARARVCVCLCVCVYTPVPCVRCFPEMISRDSCLGSRPCCLQVSVQMSSDGEGISNHAVKKSCLSLQLQKSPFTCPAFFSMCHHRTYHGCSFSLFSPKESPRWQGVCFVFCSIAQKSMYVIVA